MMARAVLRRIPLIGLLRWPLSFLIIGNAHSPGPVAAGISPTPLLIFHGTADRVVPYDQGKLLYEAAKEPKELVTIPDGHHTDAFVRPDSPYRRRLVDFYRAALQ